MADIPELPFVTNRRSGTSLVYEGRAYKLRYTSKRGVALSSVHQFLLVPLGRCKANFIVSFHR
ncbi:hypothetical protein T01_10751 [Trichinella spiralis]|uniref:Uncharacterized protein n=1 Tax=Trichinella spiralis TaxID=6334 RepID=A0A0V1AWJ3_TRISP|nr:hypothetical protein T01_10751 [Trichinella spiralis]